MEFLTQAPMYFKNICIESMNDDVRNENKKNTRRAAQAAINKMKG
jgi:hypothetical protein